MPATSLPASGSEHAYAAKQGSEVSCPRYFCFWASVPAMMRGIAPSMLLAVRVVCTATQP
jgi:hypothetical protein